MLFCVFRNDLQIAKGIRLSFCMWKWNLISSPAPQSPSLLQRVFTNDISAAWFFRNHIGAYDSVQALSSIGMAIDILLSHTTHNVMEWVWYYLALGGRIYHQKIGSILQWTWIFISNDNTFSSWKHRSSGFGKLAKQGNCNAFFFPMQRGTSKQCFVLEAEARANLAIIVQ